MKSVVLVGNFINKSNVKIIENPFYLENAHIPLGILLQKDVTLDSIAESDNKVVVKKKAFSCNFRDKAIILYNNAFIKGQCKKGIPAFSYIGSEFAGEVVEVGAKVTTFKVGDRVIPNIAYPSYDNSYIPGLPSNHGSKRLEIFHENKLLGIPSHMPYEIAACFPIAAFTAYSMIRKVIKPNAKVLVTAAKSNTSLAVINALKNFDVDVYAMSSSYRNIGELKKMGVKQTFIVDHSLEDFSINKDISAFLYDNIGFDVVIDPLFDIHLGRVINLMNYDSKYITCGLYNQFPDFNFTPHNYKGLPLDKIMVNAMIKNISIIGNCIGLKEDFDLALMHYNKGSFDILIDKVFTSGEEADFFNLTYNFNERIGKVVYKYED